MHVLVTAGPTRQYIDAVRFISNASSGKMGYAVATAATDKGHQVTLLSGPVAIEPPSGVHLEQFVSVAELKGLLGRYFPDCDVLVMAAAVGDFRAETIHERKLHRSDGPVELRLVPTEDVVAEIASSKRPDQVVIVFAVEDGTREQMEDRARSKMNSKNADYVVVNTPAAMSADQSETCILSPTETILPWASRPKSTLAQKIISILERGS